MREIKFKLFKKYDDWTYLDTVNIVQLCDYSEELSYLKIAQFTGMKDNKGKDIYEGDILSCDREWYEGKLIIIYNEDKARFEVSKSIRSSHKDILTNVRNGFNVIGNRYENPELLK